jgi:low temperature requirement protein LtrA
VIAGATRSGLELTTARVIAFGLAFLAMAALWWLYFSLVATIAERRLAVAENRTVLARDGLHVPARGDRRRASC